ncbi:MULTISPECIES: hypothetical protein [unclassified Paenibacillus]|uniref:hypothetical protein n=1 Tax=unclassified Paenibacillus TaxID=185978 RepID=UPI002781C621|nr:MULTISPECIES: hypothetical protein [unclassified Paenibacillus]MDQ0897541.1 alpha-galactosidase [Paenibacillus sp. V4I7]MDQ0916449.1 alpha-galactosidase [Paenibacillus sp. V4I5]
MAIDIITNPTAIHVETEQGWRILNLQDGSKGKWSSADIEVQTGAKSEGLVVTLASSVDAVKFVKLRWNFRLQEKYVILGDHWERAYGDLEWRGIVPERIMPWYFLTNNGVVTDGYGVRTSPNAFCSWQIDKDGLTFTADVRNGAGGVNLGARQLEVATIVTRSGSKGESAFTASQKFCKQMCEKPVLPSQPVYGGNNWYYAYGKSSRDQILADSRFISSLASSPDNRPYMVIDDGWQLASGDGSCKGGPWTGNALFPDMPGLAREMKEIGVRPGIWCRPLMWSGEVPDEWVRYVVDPNDKILDPSHPEVLAHISKSIQEISSWGFELIKHDFSTYDLLGKWGFQMKSDPNGLSHAFFDQSKTTAEITLDLYRTIAEASGSSLLIGCNTVSHLSAGLFDIQRTGDDTSGKSWERTRYMGINTLAFRMGQHGTFFSHDADCIGITEQIPWEINKNWLHLLAGSGTPLFVSVDPAIVTKEQESELRAAFDLVSQQLPTGEPLDWMETTCPSRWLLNGKESEFVWNQTSMEGTKPADNHWWL